MPYSEYCYTSEVQTVNAKHQKKIVVIGHNPPRKDFSLDGTVVAKISKLCRILNYGYYELVNLYSIVTPNSSDIKSKRAATEENYESIANAVKTADLVVAGWGDNGANFGIDKEVTQKVTSETEQRGISFIYVSLTKKKNPSHIRWWPESKGLTSTLENNIYK